MISAYSRLFAGPWSFDEQVLTDQNPREIVLMTLREKLLDHVAKDVPYNLKLRIIEWKVGCKTGS